MVRKNAERDKRIVKDVAFGKTLEAAANENGITSVRVRQIFAKAAREAGIKWVHQRKSVDQGIDNGIDLVRLEMRKLYS